MAEPSSSRTGTQVKKEALPKLLNLLYPVVHSWDLFAQQIGVPPAQISQIKAANPQTGPSYLNTCFAQSLDWWKSNHDNPVYESIIDVLDPGIGKVTPTMNRALASEVREFMTKEQSTFEAVFSKTTPGPTTVDDYTKQNIMVIQGKFAKLLQIVRKYLQKKMNEDQIKDDLRLFILELFPDISPDLIPNSSNLKDIFEAMRRNRLWNYINYFALEQIVKQFCGDNPEMIAEIEKFKKDRAGFQLATKIRAYIPAAKACKHEQLNPVNPDHFTKLSHKLDECVADYSLKYLEELWQSLSFHMQLPPIALLFETIESGCIQIDFLIPTKLVPRVIYQAQYSAYFYRMYHICSVTVGHNSIYESTYTEKDSLVTMAMKQVIPEGEPILEGGYSCDFVEPPPEGLKIECHVCLQIHREPHVVSCCSNHFCKSCINRIKVDGKSCPLCKAATFEVMHDKDLERSQKNLKVYCIHAESGCRWTGELRLLDEHLNVNPKPETLLEGCDFLKIKCIHCGYHCQRNLLTSHQIEECQKWPTHRGGHFPSLRELDQLPSVATVWYRLGLQLGVRVDDLDMMENKYPRDADMCKIKMFAEWQRGDTNPTYEQLARALAVIGKRKLAESVCSTQGISPSVLDATGTMKMHDMIFLDDPLHPGNSALEEGSPPQKISLDSMDQQKPTLKELQKCVIYQVALKWEDLGIELNLDDDGTLINSISKKRGGDAAKCCLDVLKAWLQGRGEEPKTWRTLVDCLREIKAEEAIRSIEKYTLQSISATYPSQLSPAAQPSTIDYTLKLKPGEQIRSYQSELAEPGIKGENYIICAPTGTGKTLVAGLIISEHLQKGKFFRKPRKVIFIVNTKPLAQQQMGKVQKMIPGASVKCCTGDDAVLSTIQVLLKEEDVIVCTAGKLLNELSDSKVRLDEISLIIVDECHHTRKNAPYARVMGCYLKEKQSGRGELPQVVGFTASPGAGDNPRLDLDKTIDHLNSLCALMDATSGIKTVTDNIEELEKHTNKPTFRLQILPCRDSSEAFIVKIAKEMANLETVVDLWCPFRRWSQQYETAIQQKKLPLEMDPSPEHRDTINTLKLLRCYSQTLNIYMDLRHEDAIAVLNQFSDLPTVEQATSHEKKLIHSLECLKSELVKLPKVHNPLLIQVAEKLKSHFSRKPESKGICFVRSKKHAHAMCDWISKLSTDSGVEIRPKEFVGHTRETGPGMTPVDQEDAMKGFHEGKYNMLVATSVAEEGLDVPACNLVIRFQHVSNEIARKQTMGRARAAESEGYTILSSDSKKPYLQEMKNKDLDALVMEALQYLPTGERLQQIVMEKQEEIMNPKRLVSKRRINEGADRDSIKLRCKVCKVFACKGSDIYKTESNYVVADEDFKENKITTEKYPSPKKRAVNSRTNTSGEIFCKNCGTKWGGMCIWPSAGYELPILKCKFFIFEIEGYPRPVRKWSEAPFEIPPLSSHPKYQRLED